MKNDFIFMNSMTGRHDMATLQVRTMDDDLYKALGRRAALDNRSISQEVVSIIKEFLSKPQTSSSPDEEALKLAGAWNDSRSAEEISEAIRADRNSNRVSGEF
jgi:plasmid stability protein